MTKTSTYGTRSSVAKDLSMPEQGKKKKKKKNCTFAIVTTLFSTKYL